MNCEICEKLDAQYRTAVDALHVANQHLRVAKLGTLQFALCRREVHDSLNGLVDAERASKEHRMWHVAALTIAHTGRTATL